MSFIVKIDRTLVSLAAAVLLAVLLVPARCFAFDYAQITGSTAKGANIKDYDKCIKLDVTDFGADSEGEEDSWKAIQYALNYAVDNASDEVQIKVVIPEGTYSISKPLKIYSNTWLYMEGATIRRDYNNGRMLWNAQQYRQGGYDDDRNIIIEGGCFDGNATNMSTDFSNIRLGHCKNIWIKNVEIKNNYNGHHLELGGVKNVTVEGCNFHGYYGSSVKEALQLDVMNNWSLFNSYLPYDDTPCDNIVIRNNKFSDLVRGIGSHSAVFGVYYTNIHINGNTFDNIYDCAMIMQNYKNCIIENNVMKGVGCGIDFMNMAPVEYNRYFLPVTGTSGIYDKINNNCNTIIRKNSMSVVVTGYRPEPVGIQLYGRMVRSGYYPEFDYKVEGVKVSENKIKTAGSAIILNDTNGVQVNSNTTAFDNSGSVSSANLIDVRASSECSLTGNKVSGGDYSGIYVGGCSGVEVQGNVCASQGSAGICISLNSDEVSVSGNKINTPLSNGITVTKQAHADITGNTVVDAAADGILLTEGYGDVKDNTVSGSGKNGIELINTGDAEASGNTLSGSGGRGINIREGAKIVIADNTYSDNVSGDVGVSGGAVYTKAAQSVAADGVYQDHVQLSWQPVSEADGYIIQRRLTDAQDSFYEAAEVTSTSYVDMALPSKTKYEYAVQAVKYIDGRRYPGKLSGTVTVRTKAAMSDCESDLPSVMKYTGRKIEPSFNIYLDGSRLVPEIDYKVKYYNNTAVGRATVAVTGCGQYCGYKEFTFEIKISSGESAEQTNSFSDLKDLAGSVSDNCVVAVTAKGFGGKLLSPSVRHSSSSYILDSIQSAKLISGIEITSRRVRSSGGYSTYGLWL